jgi:hypothetical protein
LPTFQSEKSSVEIKDRRNEASPTRRIDALKITFPSSELLQYVLQPFNVLLLRRVSRQHILGPAAKDHFLHLELRQIAVTLRYDVLIKLEIIAVSGAEAEADEQFHAQLREQRTAQFREILSASRQGRYGQQCGREDRPPGAPIHPSHGLASHFIHADYAEAR